MRLRHLHPDELDAEQRLLYEAVVGGARQQAHASLPPGARLTDSEGRLQGPFNALLFQADLGTALVGLTGNLRFRGQLSPRVRELVILVVASAEQSDFEWSAHAALALGLGIPDDVVSAIGAGLAVELDDPDEETACNVARALVAQGDLDDETYHRCQRTLGDSAMVEISTLVGIYQMIAMQLRLFRVAAPPGPWQR